MELSHVQYKYFFTVLLVVNEYLFVFCGGSAILLCFLCWCFFSCVIFCFLVGVFVVVGCCFWGVVPLLFFVFGGCLVCFLLFWFVCFLFGVGGGWGGVVG